MNQSGNDKSAIARQALESRYTYQRIAGLRIDPVRGDFDAAHSKEWSAHETEKIVR